MSVSMGSMDDSAPRQPRLTDVTHHGLPGAEEFLEPGFLVAEFGVDVGGEVQVGDEPSIEGEEA
jgi:hypothetical protein